MGIGVKTFEVQSGFSVDSVPPEVAELISRLEKHTLSRINNYVLRRYGRELTSLDPGELANAVGGLISRDQVRVNIIVGDLMLRVATIAAAYRRFVESCGSDETLRAELSKIGDPDEKLYRLLELLGVGVARLSRLFAEELRSQGLDPLALPADQLRSLKEIEDRILEHAKKMLAEHGHSTDAKTLDDIAKALNSLPPDLANGLKSYITSSIKVSIKTLTVFDTAQLYML